MATCAVGSEISAEVLAIGPRVSPCLFDRFEYVRFDFGRTPGVVIDDQTGILRWAFVEFENREIERLVNRIGRDR